MSSSTIDNEDLLHLTKSVNTLTIHENDTFCFFDKMSMELLYCVYEYLLHEYYDLLSCNKQINENLTNYIHIKLSQLTHLYQNDPCVILPKIRTCPKWFQLITILLRIKHQRWILLEPFLDDDYDDEFMFGKFLRHCDYQMKLSRIDSIKYDFQYQFMKLGNGYYKIMNPYQGGYCMNSSLRIVPNRDYDMDDISWIIEVSSEYPDTVTLKSVKNYLYLGFNFNTLYLQDYEIRNCRFVVRSLVGFTRIPVVFTDKFSRQTYNYSCIDWVHKYSKLEATEKLKEEEVDAIDGYMDMLDDFGYYGEEEEVQKTFYVK